MVLPIGQGSRPWLTLDCTIHTCMVGKDHSDIFNTAAYGGKTWFAIESVYYPAIEDDSELWITKKGSICYEQKWVPPRKFMLIFEHSIRGKVKHVSKEQYYLIKALWICAFLLFFIYFFSCTSKTGTLAKSRIQTRPPKAAQTTLLAAQRQ
jgi:hypothetical protein